MLLRLIDVLSRFQFEISKAVGTSAVRVKVRVPPVWGWLLLWLEEAEWFRVYVPTDLLWAHWDIRTGKAHWVLLKFSSIHGLGEPFHRGKHLPRRT